MDKLFMIIEKIVLMINFYQNKITKKINANIR